MIIMGLVIALLLSLCASEICHYHFITITHKNHHYYDYHTIDNDPTSGQYPISTVYVQSLHHLCYSGQVRILSHLHMASQYIISFAKPILYNIIPAHVMSEYHL